MYSTESLDRLANVLFHFRPRASLISGLQNFEKTEVRFIFSGEQGLEQLARFPQFDNITQNKLYMPLEFGQSIFLVDLALEKSPGK